MLELEIKLSNHSPKEQQSEEAGRTTPRKTQLAHHCIPAFSASDPMLLPCPKERLKGMLKKISQGGGLATEKIFKVVC